MCDISFVSNFLSSVCPQMHSKRLTALKSVVASAINGSNLSVTTLGRGINSIAKEKHCIKRADRLLSNSKLQSERIDIYREICLKLIGSKRHPNIIVDWCTLDSNNSQYLLRAAMAVDGRSLTLYEEIHGVDTYEKTTAHTAFLNNLDEIIPEDCEPIIITDAGFRGPWFKAVESLGWDWVGRIRGEVVYSQESCETWESCSSLYQSATTKAKLIQQVTLSRRNQLECTLVVFKGKHKGRIRKNKYGKRARGTSAKDYAKRSKDPWLLATSLPVTNGLAKKVVKLYQRRMQIEEGFRDLKAPEYGLGFSNSRSYILERIQILMLIATLATMILCLVGLAVEQSNQHRQFQANTYQTRVLSFIFLGLRAFGDPRVTLSSHHLYRAYKTIQTGIHEYDN